MTKRRLLSFLLVICMLLTGLTPGMAAAAEETEPESVIVDVTDYGADPLGIRDSAEAISRAVEAAKEVEGPKIISFPKGEYQIYPDKAPERELYISNTVGANQAYKMKRFGILLEDMKDVTVEGNGSLFLLHGKMTAFGALRCENVTFQNYSIDYQVPTVVDITVEAVEENAATVYIPECYPYEIDGDGIVWKSEESPYTGEVYWTGRNTMGYSQVYDIKTSLTVRAGNRLFSNVERIEDLGENRVKFLYKNMDSSIRPGLCYQMRTGVRDHAGTFFWKCKNVELNRLNIHFLHGFGMVGQSSDGIHFNEVHFQAPEGSGRTTAGYADFIQMSGCKGEIRIENSSFSNPHDDPINIHGTFLQVVERISDTEFKVRYMHNETAGFPSFFEGDEVEFMTKGNMIPVQNSTAKVIKVQGPTGEGGAAQSGTGSLTDSIITLDRAMPEEIGAGTHVVENITYTPGVVIENNLFKNTPTRGILVTTRKKVEIRGNEFDGMGMAAVYISNDAQGWYESGPVRDVTIENNVFRRSGLGTSTQAVIYIDPTNPTVSAEQTVHENITVRNNTFYMKDNKVLEAKSVKNLAFTGNEIYRYDPHVRILLSADRTDLIQGETLPVLAKSSASSLNSGLFAFNGCKAVTLADNLYDGGLKKSAVLSNMSREEISLGQGEDIALDGGSDTGNPVGRIIWDSSDETVVKVTSSGMVQAVGPGEAEVTAAGIVGGRKFISDPLLFTVETGEAEDGPESIRVTAEKETSDVIGEEVHFLAEVFPQEADQTVQWRVEDPVTGEESSCAEIDENGVLRTLSNGAVEVVASGANGREEGCLFVIQAPSQALSGEMEIVNEDASGWETTENGGILIRAHSSGLWDTQTVHNIFVNNPSEDLTNVSAVVRMNGKTKADYDEAGLIFYKDNDNYVAAERKHGAGSPKIHLVTETGREPDESGPVSDMESEEVWLKLEKTGDSVTGYCSGDGSSWTQIRQVTNAALGNSFGIGFLAGSGSDSGTPLEFLSLSVNGKEVPLTAINHGPTASEVAVEYTEESGKLKASWKTTDPDTDPEGKSIVRWMVSDTQEGDYSLIPDLEGREVTVSPRMAGNYVKAVVIPMDWSGMCGAPEVSGQAVHPIEAGVPEEEQIKSAEARLAEAEFTGLEGFENFSEEEHAYFATAAARQKHIRLKLAARDTNASLKVALNGKVLTAADGEQAETENPELELVPGLNLIEVTVLAQDERSQEVYRFAVIRRGWNEKTLTGIRMDGLSLEGFSPEKTDYSWTAPRGAETLDIEALGAHESAEVMIVANQTGEKGDTARISLLPGINEVLIRVKPDTSGEPVIYRVSVQVPSDVNANLKAMELSGGIRLNEEFEADITEYTGTVSAPFLQAELTAEEEQAFIEVRADGEVLGEGPGSCSGRIPMYLGENEITITVTAPDQTSRKEYSLRLEGQESVYLSDMDYDREQSFSGYGPVANKDLSTDGNPLTLLGEDGQSVVFEKGMGTHATAALVYDIEGLGYQKFSTYMGIDLEVGGKNEADAVFRIYVDGVQVYESGVTDSATPMLFAEVPVAGAKELKVTADKLTYDYSDHVDFAGAAFTTGLEKRREICEIRYEATPKEGGAVKAQSEDEEDISGVLRVRKGDSVTLTACANEGYRFTGWYRKEGGKVSLKEQYTFVAADRNVSFEAGFEKTEDPVRVYTVSCSAVPEEGGEVTAEYKGSMPDPEHIRVPEGSHVILRALPDPGYQFTGWFDGQGEKVSSSEILTLTSVGKDKTLEARFRTAPVPDRKFKIYYRADWEAAGTVQAEYDEKTETSGMAVVKEGTAVTLTAKAKTGFRFLGWFDGKGTRVSDSLTCKLEGVTQDGIYLAGFEKILTPLEEKYTVTVVSGAGGRAEGSCTVSAGGTAVLTAKPAPGCRFAGWYKDGMLISGISVLTVQNIRSNGVYEARFSKKEVQSPGKPKLKLKKRGRNGVILKWNIWSEPAAAGFEVYRKEGKKPYKKIRIVSGKKRSCMVNRLKKGKIFRFRIRGYCMEEGKKIYGEYSKAVKVRIR